MSQTQKGVDLREYPMPERYSHLRKDRGYKTLKYGHTLYLTGPGLTTKITDEIRNKINDNKSVVICVTGPPGSGKTYAGERFAQTIDPDFKINDIPPPPPNEDDGQVTFKGYVLIIIVLHTRMIDALLRDFVVNYEFHVTKRGEARVYRRWFPIHAKEAYKKKLGHIKLQLPDEALCNYDSCLRGRKGCPHLHKPKGKRCMTIRAIYERRKKLFLDEKGRKEEEEYAATKYDDLEQIIIKISAHKEKIPRKKNGEIHKSRFIVWIKQLGFKVRYREESALFQLAKEAFD